MVLDSLRNQLNYKVVKAENIRKACRFRLFRYSELLKSNSFRALNIYASNMKQASLM